MEKSQDDLITGDMAKTLLKIPLDIEIIEQNMRTFNDNYHLLLLYLHDGRNTQARECFIECKKNMSTVNGLALGILSDLIPYSEEFYEDKATDADFF